MDKILVVNIFDYQLIKLEDIYSYPNLQYSMYAILSFDRMYFDKPRNCLDHAEVDYGNEAQKSQGFIQLEPNSDCEKADLILSSKYPQDVLNINDDKEGIIASDVYAFKNEAPSFEIEYIGISKANTACTRLSSHATLQKILVDNQSKHINKDFYILLFNANHMEIKELKIQPYVQKNVDNDITDKEAQSFMEQFNEAYTNVDVVTALTEAILINQIKPKYNIEYMKSEPKKLFSTLKTLYQYSFDRGVVNLSLKESVIGKDITLFTNTKTLKFNRETMYGQIIECPFSLNDDR